MVNSVFLYYATKAGLDLAIVNAEKLERFASIPIEERRLAENLLFNTPPPDAEDESLRTAPEDWRQQTREQKIAINQFHIAAITEYARRAGKKEKKKTAELPLDERLANYIIEGTKDGLIPDLERKLAEGAGALEIINGPLMTGMTEVGRLFNNNELIVAEVLQSAEAMKASVNYLEQFMEKTETSTRGRIVLATVKGDVHDIGKNLVEIILSNNGYQVINLGIKVPPEDLIRAWREHQPDAIGLSGLLVKSAHQMVTTASDFKDHDVKVPLLVGGAALSEKFTTTRIGPAYGAPTFYAKDAMTGLRIMNELMEPSTREVAISTHIFTSVGAAPAEPAPAINTATLRSPKVRTDIPIPAAPYLDRRIREVPNLHEVWSYINPYMLFGRHLGFKGNFEKLLAERDPKALELYHDVEKVKQEAAKFMKIRAVWQFYEAERDGNSIHLFAPGAQSPLHTFRFGRQPKSDGLCLSDYILDAEEGRRDHLGFFVVTAGECVRSHSEEAKQRGEFLLAHALQALAIETAEGCAEWLHRRMREDWGFPDPPTMTMQERFTSRYRGKRYSFGYPACPNLDDQQGIWKLLQPDDIGVKLTDGMMMDPGGERQRAGFSSSRLRVFHRQRDVSGIPAFYPILDTEIAARHGIGVVSASEKILEGGARILQFRHKGFWSRDTFADLRTVGALCRDAGALLVVNDRADIARLTGAALHLGQDDLTPADARRIVDAGTIIGFSTHNEHQFREALDGAGGLRRAGSHFRHLLQTTSRPGGRSRGAAPSSPADRAPSGRDRRHHARECSGRAGRRRRFTRGDWRPVRRRWKPSRAGGRMASDRGLRNLLGNRFRLEELEQVVRAARL